MKLKMKFCLVLIVTLLSSFSIGIFAAPNVDQKQENVVISTVETTILETTTLDEKSMESNDSINSITPAASLPVGTCDLKYTAQDDFGAKIDWTVSAADLITSVDLTLLIDEGSAAQKIFKYSTFPWFSQHNSYNYGWHSQGVHTATLKGTYTTVTGTIYSVYNTITFTVYIDGV